MIVGTESWLNPSVKSSEIFAPQFEVFRQDRSDGYGGVFLACSKMYNWESFGFTNSYNNVEVVACKLKLNHHLLIILAVYRPPNSDSAYLQSFCNLMQDVATDFPAATIWMGGDINLPNIDWITNSHKGNDYTVSFCNLVLELFSDLGIYQMITFPTIGSNTFDIFATNRPNFINRCTPIPGISDHDGNSVESFVTAKYRCPAPEENSTSGQKQTSNYLKKLL